MRRLAAVLLLGCALAFASAGPAAAGDIGPSPADDGGLPDGFVALFVLALIVSVGVTVYKVSMARTMARRSGMDQRQATEMTLLTDDGLEATYLAANLRPGAEEPAAGRSVTERLAELERLREQGLVNQAEYDERRAAILGSL